MWLVKSLQTQINHFLNTYSVTVCVQLKFYVWNSRETGQTNSLDLLNYLRPFQKKTQFGRQDLINESECLCLYADENPLINVKKCGVFVNRFLPWFKVEPDAIGYDSRIEKYFLIEVKTSFEKRPLAKMNLTIEGLKRLTPKYYAQIQFTLYLLNLNYCDLLYFHQNERNFVTFKVPIDRVYCEFIIKIYTNYYFLYYLPFIIAHLENIGYLFD